MEWIVRVIRARVDTAWPMRRCRKEGGGEVSVCQEGDATMDVGRALRGRKRRMDGGVVG